MLERFGGDEEIINVIVESFSEEAAELIKQIESAMEKLDIEAIRSACHALKGSASNVHAIPLSRKAQLLEAAAKQGKINFTLVSPFLGEIKTDFNRFLSEIAHD